KPLKTVVSAPFHPFPRSVRRGEYTLFPKPPWFLTNKTSESTARKLTEFTAAPSAAKLPALFAPAPRGGPMTLPDYIVVGAGGGAPGWPDARRVARFGFPGCWW